MSAITPELLTAYALGEASPADQTLVEAHLATSPADRAEVEAIRSAAALLSSSLADEGSPGLDPVRRQALAALPAIPPARRKIIAFPHRFPHRIVWPGVLAACLVVGVVSQSQPVAPADAPAASSPVAMKREAAPAMLMQEKETTQSATTAMATPSAAPAPAAEAFSMPAAPPALALDQPQPMEVAAVTAKDTPAKARRSVAADADAAAGAVAEAEDTRAEAKPLAATAAGLVAGNSVPAAKPASADKADLARAELKTATETDGLAKQHNSAAPSATGSVASLRAHLTAGHWPPPDTVSLDNLLAAFAPPRARGDRGPADTASTADRFAAAVTEFANILRLTPGTGSLEHVLQLATANAEGRAERLDFIALVRQAQRVHQTPQAAPLPAAAATPQGR